MNNNYLLFSDSTKIADIIQRNYKILSVLPRFDIHLGFGENTVAKLCQKKGINKFLFLMVCNIHTFEEYLPSSEELAQIDIADIVGYLKASHKYYAEKGIAVIEKKLKKMTALQELPENKLLKQFFNEYKKEVINHFKYEETTVFPYINHLSAGETSVNYHIVQYEETHGNIDDKLSDLKNIIIKYLPDNYDIDLRNALLMDIFLFEEDLELHTRIEDKILVPYVKEIEHHHEE